MDEKNDKQLIQYLTKLAVDNPELLPYAMLKLAEYRLKLTVMEYLRAYVNQVEEKLLGGGTMDYPNNIPENINIEELIRINNKIEETEARIKELEEKRREVLNSTGDQSRLHEIDEWLYLLNDDLRRCKRERSDLLGYYDNTAL